MKFLAESHVGKVRQINEDAYDVKLLENGALFVVCDGIGGEKAGEVASELACSEIVKNFTATYRPELEINTLKNLLISSVSRANIIVCETARSDERYERMGCTVAAAFLRGDTLQVVHAGDSRVYAFDADGLRQVTTDHTVAQMLLEQGKIGAEDVESIPEKNIITRAVGIQMDINLEYTEEYLSDHAAVLLCTDGMYRYCTDEEIAEFIFQEDAAKKLVDLANERGGADNITVLIGRCEEGDLNG